MYYEYFVINNPLAIIEHIKWESKGYVWHSEISLLLEQAEDIIHSQYLL